MTSVSAVSGPEPDVSAAWDLLIRQARLLDQPEVVDIAVRNGRIDRIAEKIPGPAAHAIDARGGLVTPSFIDPHFHLDKVLSRAHFGAVSYQEGFGRARDVKKHFTVADVEERACRALDLAVAQGMGRMRTNVDVDFATRLISMEGILRARDRFRGLIDLEIIAFPQEGIVTDPEAPGLLREAIDMGADLVGGLPEFEQSAGDQKTHIEQVFDIAEEKGVPLDFHCDYTDLPEFKTLEMVADETIRRGMQGRVTAGHCCALAVYPDDEARRVIDKVKAAEITVTVLPIANLQMLGGPARTPVNRGSSRIKELLDAGDQCVRRLRQHVRHMVPLQPDGPGRNRLSHLPERRHAHRRGGARGVRHDHHAAGAAHGPS